MAPTLITVPDMQTDGSGSTEMGMAFLSAITLTETAIS